MDNYKHPHILITGAASGIGAACAKQLAGCGCNLFLHTGTQTEKLHKLANELREENNATVFCFTYDFWNENSVSNFINHVIEDAGYIDQLVINAGYADKGDFETLTAKKLNDALAVMVEAPAKLIRAFIADIKKSEQGRIVSISSFVNKTSGLNDTFFTATATAKSALEGLTLQAARQLRLSPATANIVSPGYTRKDKKESAFSEKQWEQLASQLPSGKLVEPYEVASLVSYLLSKNGAMITGQNIIIDNGLSLK